MGNFSRVFIAVILIISLFTVSVFATPTGTYDLYGTNGRVVTGYTGSGNDYISNFSGHLANIRVYLDQILSYNANISSTLDYYLPALFQRMVDAFSPGAGDTRSMWQLSAAAVSGITAIQSAALGIAQDVYNINTTTADINRLTGLIHSDVDQVESQLTSVNTNLQSLESINWITNSNYRITYSNDNITYYQNLVDLPSTNTLYIKIVGYPNNYCLALIDFNFNFDSYEYYDVHNNIHFDFLDYNYPIYPDYFYNCSYNTIKLFLYPFTTFNASSIIVKLSYNKNFTFYNNSSVIFRYLPFDSNDFYIVDNFIQSHKKSEDTTLSDIKNILIDIDNNSDFIQNNNDLQINVDIDSSVGSGVTGVISKIQDLLDFGISLQEFIVVLNQFDNLQWFTRPETYEQVNQDPRFSPGYIDLYD